MKKGRPFVVGHADYPFTQIPARDGLAHGGIKRSNRFPNCSFFTNWKTLDDKVTWTIDVGETGKYEVDLYYTCPKADIGSTIQLSFQGESVKARISEAHDPPLVGAEQDRYVRGESYVKDFKVLYMGAIHLEKGKGDLTLQALKIPGGSVMDFRLLMLKRQK